MSNGIFTPPIPVNEPIKNYAPQSEEKRLLKLAIAELESSCYDIPVIIDGKEYRSGNTAELRSPSDHKRCFGRYHVASPEQLTMAIAAAQKAKKQWSDLPWVDRASIFLKAAELLSGSWRYKINAATMLGQGKTVYQAEIDSACELIDFLRFNATYMSQIYSDQPQINSKGVWNRLEYLPLEGFVLAITPFNLSLIHI